MINYFQTLYYLLTSLLIIRCVSTSPEPSVSLGDCETSLINRVSKFINFRSKRVVSNNGKCRSSNTCCSINKCLRDTICQVSMNLEWNLHQEQRTP